MMIVDDDDEYSEDDDQNQYDSSEEFFDDDDDEMSDVEGSEDDSDEDDDEPLPQPAHFRECLRMMDAALTGTGPPELPRWCASGEIGVIDDPKLTIDGFRGCLPLPLKKQRARRLIRQAMPLPMKIDLINGVSFSPSAWQLSPSSFNISNPQWTSKVVPNLKQSYVARTLQLDPNGIDVKLSQLAVIGPCQYPRQFNWPKDEPSIAKLFITLPSSFKGGKETITHFKEKHIFNVSEKHIDSSYFTIVPSSAECKHEIQPIFDGYKLVLIYDIILRSSNVLFNVTVNDATVARIGRILETWLDGLDHEYQGYTSKVIIPLSETFIMNSNYLLHGVDRITGTLLRRAIERYHPDKFLLYQAIIRPNRSNDGTVHACRLLNDLNLMKMNNNTAGTLFEKIDTCLGNCNETHAANIFLRKIRSEQGNLISVEQFNVPVWCLVPVVHKYDLLVDNIPRVINHLTHHLIPLLRYRTETFSLINWLLTTRKKIHFNGMDLLHQLLLLLTEGISDATILNDTIRQLLEHKKFIEQLLPMEDYHHFDDIIRLLNTSNDPKIHLHIHQLFRAVLKRPNRDSSRIREAIKFIAILSRRHVHTGFLFVLIHELLSNIFKLDGPMPSTIDLASLLALLSLSIESYAPSCEAIARQIVRQLNSTATTMNTVSTINNLLQPILIPTLIRIHRHFNNNHSINQGKRKSTVDNCPSWFTALLDTCLTLIDAHCNILPSIPIYANLHNHLNVNCCSICKQLFVFLHDKHAFQRTFLVPTDQLIHVDKITKKFTPLVTIGHSMTSDNHNHQITLLKLSVYEEETWRENKLLRKLLLDLKPKSIDFLLQDRRSKKHFKNI